MLFGGAVSRLFSRIVNVLPVDPDRTVRASLRLARDTLRDGGVLIWFPEGRRSPTGQLQEIMPGIGELLEDGATYVVPMWIHGTFDAAPAGRTVPRLRPIRVRIGAAVSPAELAGHGRGETMRQRLVDGIKQILEELGAIESV